MSPRPRDKQVRCPYCHRALAQGHKEYLPQKYCPSCGAELPSPNKPRFNAMMHGARYIGGALAGRACPLEIMALIAATMFIG